LIKFVSTFLLAVLTLAQVDQVSDGWALVIHDECGEVKTITVPLEGAPCVPSEGQYVILKNQTIVECVEYGI
jgi:hypothetical protein